MENYVIYIAPSQAYSLKDYKQLMPDVTLQGLGPDYTAIEKTVSINLQLQCSISRNCHWPLDLHHQFIYPETTQMDSVVVG